MRKETGGPAFPESCGDQIIPGMTLRDWFAGQALKGLMSNPGGPIQANGVNGWGYVNCTPEQVAQICGEQADAMLAERSKE